MKDRLEGKCRYASNLIERFKTFYGRIGTWCDDCKLECVHCKASLTDEGIDNGYAMLKLGE